MTLQRKYIRVCPHCGATFETRTANTVICGLPACVTAHCGTDSTHWHYPADVINARILRIARASGSPLSDAEIIETCREIDAVWRWTA
jgi:hypothetical protein